MSYFTSCHASQSSLSFVLCFEGDNTGSTDGLGDIFRNDASTATGIFFRGAGLLLCGQNCLALSGLADCDRTAGRGFDIELQG